MIVYSTAIIELWLHLGLLNMVKIRELYLQLQGKRDKY